MSRRRQCFLGLATALLAECLAASHSPLKARPLDAEAVRIDNDDIGGVVTSVQRKWTKIRPKFLESFSTRW